MLLPVMRTLSAALAVCLLIASGTEKVAAAEERYSGVRVEPRLQFTPWPYYVPMQGYPYGYPDSRLRLESVVVCTSLYGTAICQCKTKCVAKRNDCRCADN